MTTDHQDGDAHRRIDDTGPTVDRPAFEAAYGESLAATLNLDTWEGEGDLAALYERIQSEVKDAVETATTFGNWAIGVATVEIGNAVAADVIDANIDDVGAFLHLLAADGRAGVDPPPIASDQGLLEFLGAVGVGAFADDEDGEVLAGGFDKRINFLVLIDRKVEPR